MKQVKVAIDSGPLKSGHKVRGVGVYAREILEALGEEADKRRDLDLVPLDFSTQSSKLKAKKFDIIHYTYFNPFFITLPFRKPAKQKVIVTIHDTIPLIYPKYYPPGIRGKVKFQIQKYLLKNVDGVIVPSETSKKDIVRFLGVPQEKIKVIYEAHRKIFKPITSHKSLIITKRKYNLPTRFVLYVGDVNYNKNIPGLIEACRLAKVPLVICGKQAKDIELLGLGLDLMKGPMDWFRYLFNIPHPELAHFRGLIDVFRSKQKIIRPGYVPEDDLVAIYNLASVYCQPSFYEGFGLPVLEAFACGTSVVCSKTQALVEVAGDAALFVDPNDSNGMAKRLKEAIKNPTSLKLWGIRRVKEFSWEKAARQTIDFYKSVIHGQ